MRTTKITPTKGIRTSSDGGYTTLEVETVDNPTGARFVFVSITRNNKLVSLTLDKSQAKQIKDVLTSMGI